MAYHTKDIKVLVIEDNHEDLRIVEAFLKKEFQHLSLHHASALHEVSIKINTEILFDVIILDVTLPDSAGTVLVEKIMALAGNTPVIVMTGNSGKHRDFGINSLSLGVADYLFKSELSAPYLYKSIVYAIERKKISQKLQESEEKYRNLFHHNPQPMWSYDLETLTFLNVNEAAVRHYGYSREEFLNMKVTEIRLDKEASVHNEIKNKVDSGGFYKGVVRHRKKNGEIIFTEIQTRIIELNGKRSRLVLANDLTKKINAEHRLQLSEKRFKALIQDSSDLTAILNTEGKYSYVSPASQRILDLPPKYFIGKCAFDFIHPDDRERVYAEFVYLQNQKHIRISPFRFKDSSNKWRWIETVLTNMISDPAVQGIVSNSRDVTQRMEYITAIEKQNIRLREISWTQSHQVRAPLCRLMGLTNLLANHPEEIKNQQELLHHINASARELDKVIRKIVSKAEKADKQEQYEVKSNDY